MPVESMAFAVAHISGSLVVSMTAAIGIPKFETGPQKSAATVTLAYLILSVVEKRFDSHPACLCSLGLQIAGGESSELAEQGNWTHELSRRNRAKDSTVYAH